MPWQQLLIGLEKSNAEDISDWLSENTALAVTFEDATDTAILEPAVDQTPLWDELVVTALFEQNADVEAIKENLQQAFPDKILSSTILTLDDQPWERSWIKQFKAMQFGQRLWICPSWQTVPDKDAINIILDPGLAFGTGTHQTTSLCLQWLDALSLSETLTDKYLLDYGCGSGILAIAAIKLGAKHATAVDYDPQAITASKENANRNQITQQQFKALLVNADKPERLNRVDILVANILAEPLRQLAFELATLVKPGGRIALSGILNEQAEEVIQIYSKWFALEPLKKIDDWCLISGTKFD